MTLREIAQVTLIVAGCTCLLVVTAKDMDATQTVVRRVEVCSPRSVDAYSPEELIRIAQARRRISAVGGRVK